MSPTSTALRQVAAGETVSNLRDLVNTAAWQLDQAQDANEKLANALMALGVPEVQIRAVHPSLQLHWSPS
jgi:hypothetical protein